MIERGRKGLTPAVAAVLVTLLSACVTVAPGTSVAPSFNAATPAAPEPTNGPTSTPSVELPPTLSPGVNLVISEFRFVPDTIKAGELTNIQLSVKNTGSVASPPFNVGFAFTLANCGGGGFKPIPEPNGVLAGGETSYTVPRRLSDAGDYSVTAEVDNDNQIDEFDDDDNTATASLTVTPPPPGPNLVVSSFTITPTSIYNTDSAVFAYSVTNTGTKPVAGFLLVLKWVGTVNGEVFTGDYAGSFFQDMLNPGDTVSASDAHEIDTTAEYTFTAVVDPDNTVAEQFETDNEAQAQLVVH